MLLEPEKRIKIKFFDDKLIQSCQAYNSKELHCYEFYLCH